MMKPKKKNNLNTSHVNLQRTWILSIHQTASNLNTSHVNLQLSVCGKEYDCGDHLNTSHVNLQLGCNGFWLRWRRFI